MVLAEPDEHDKPDCDGIHINGIGWGKDCKLGQVNLSGALPITTRSQSTNQESVLRLYSGCDCAKTLGADCTIAYDLICADCFHFLQCSLPSQRARFTAESAKICL